jgi:hypothetical protein
LEVDMFNTQRTAAALLTTVITIGLACSLSPAASNPNAVTTAVAGTLAAGQTSTAAVRAAVSTLTAGEATPTTDATATPPASDTPGATPTDSPPTVSLTANTHCRTGPLAIYDLIRTLLIGQTAQITGKNAAGDYWYVTDANLPGEDCWLWGRYATVSGDTSAVPVFTPPPSPTATYDWSGDWQVTVNGNAMGMSLEQSGSSVSGTLIYISTYDLTASTSEGGRTAVGSYQAGGSTINFSWRMTADSKQFRGSYTEEGNPTVHPWCGARCGAPQPSPCLGP